MRKVVEMTYLAFMNIRYECLLFTVSWLVVHLESETEGEQLCQLSIVTKGSIVL